MLLSPKSFNTCLGTFFLFFIFSFSFFFSFFWFCFVCLKWQVPEKKRFYRVWLRLFFVIVFNVFRSDETMTASVFSYKKIISLYKLNIITSRNFVRLLLVWVKEFPLYQAIQKNNFNKNLQIGLLKKLVYSIEHVHSKILFPKSYRRFSF